MDDGVRSRGFYDHLERLGPPLARDGTLLGGLFESLVALSVQTYAQAAEAVVRHLRTQKGDHEVDLIVARPDERVVALEVIPAALLGP